MPSAESGAGRATFERYSGALRQLSALREKLTLTAQRTTRLTQLATHLLLSTPEPQQSPVIQQAWEEAAVAQRELDTVVGSGFKLTYMTVIETHVLTFRQKSEMTSVEEVVAEKFKGSDGPFFCSLEGALKKLHVERQAYHGGTFVGNHVHKLVQVKMRLMYLQ